MRVQQGGNSVTVTLKVPALVPGLATNIRISVRAGTVIEGGVGL
jgi:hypothetical protein